MGSAEDKLNDGEAK